MEELEDRTLPSGINHFLVDPVNGQHFAWPNENLADPAHVTIYYDFRALNGFQNVITPAEENVAVAAMSMWSSATNGRLQFVQNPSAPATQIINIGLGDLSAVGATSGGLEVGEGGDDAISTNAQGQNVLQEGFAWLDYRQSWSTAIGTGLPSGTISFFTIAAHEIGHALGLGHDDDMPGPSIMNSTYFAALTEPSASDVTNIQTLYPPLAGTPTQPLALFAVGADAGQTPEVRVFNGTQSLLDFSAYNPSFTGGVRVAVGDVTGNGTPDIVTAPGPGGGPVIHVYDGRTGILVRSFFAFGPDFTGGCYVAVGDVNRDGCADIIVGADAGGGPYVTVFSGKDGSLLDSFFAYDPSFTGGVRVAAGDVNGDGFADIICGPGAGGGPFVTVRSGRDHSQLLSFFAYDPQFTAGIYVAAGDLNHDGRADIITGPGAGGGPYVAAFSGVNAAPLFSFFAFDPNVTTGVRVSTAQGFGGTGTLILAAPGTPAPAKVALFDASPTLLDSFFAFAPLLGGGAFVSGND